MSNVPLSFGVVAATSNVAGMLAGGCLSAGAVLTAIGTWQRTVVQKLLANGKRATAVAGESVLHASNPGLAGSHLVWRFQTEDGTYVEHEGLADALHHPSKGDTARLIYDPHDPHNARLATFEERILAWALFFFSGLALVAVGLVAALIATI